MIEERFVLRNFADFADFADSLPRPMIFIFFSRKEERYEYESVPIFLPSVFFLI